jgi:colicin import membrane protein
VATRRTLYEVLQVARNATAEVIASAYEARLRALGDSAAPEILAERTLLGDARAMLTDPARRKLYDEKLVAQAMRAAASGGDAAAPRAAFAAAPAEDAPKSSPLGWMIGIAALIAVAVGGGWVHLSHKRAAQALRLEESRRADQSRQQEAEAQRQREASELAKAQYEKTREQIELQKWEAQRQRDSQQSAYQQRMEDQRKAQTERQAAYESQRQEQENLRRSQQQLQREKQYLRELEANRGMRF